MSGAKILGHWLLGLALAWTALGLALAIAGLPGLPWVMIVSGLILAAAIYFERHRYKPMEDERPGLGWVPTGERFLDPETNEFVTVYFNETTGERRYIRQREQR
jgi:hypothetical protein